MKFTSQDKASVSAGRSIRFWEVSEIKNVRILADVSSVEVFINDGEAVFLQDIIQRNMKYKFKLWMQKLHFGSYNYKKCSWQEILQEHFCI